MKTNQLSIDNQLCFSLYSTSLAMTQLYKPMLEPLGLTYPQYLVLLILWEKDGLTLKDIAEKLNQKSGSLTPVIKRLDANGVIKRSRSINSDRELHISLTAKGQQLKEQGTEINRCIFDACGITQSHLLSIKSALDELRSNLLISG